MIDFTIFTPTYNRENYLEKLYNSLLNQTYKSFEWLVVDDGSTDDTEQLILELKEKNEKNNLFNIRYYKVPNHGKHNAINIGIKECDSKYFFIVDSDDYIPENSLEIILKYLDTVPSNEFIGVGGLKSYMDKKIVGTQVNGDYFDCTSLERRKYKIFGDKAEVFKVSILKNYSFPVFENENFVTESVMWFKIANDGYKIRWFNEIVYYCEYLDTGLTSARGKYFKNFEGFLYKINDELRYKEIPLFEKIKQIAQCSAYAIIKKIPLAYVSKKINVSRFWLALLGYPSSLLMRFIFWRRK